MKSKLDIIFHEQDDCKENQCSINKKGIEYIFKPDMGIKDKTLQEELFAGIEQPKLCDCIIKKDVLILLEIKLRKITTSILNEIIEQLSNVGKILKHKDIDFNKVVFIYKTLDNPKMKQIISKKNILGQRLECIQFKKEAINL